MNPRVMCPKDNHAKNNHVSLSVFICLVMIFCYSSGEESWAQQSLGSAGGEKMEGGFSYVITDKGKVLLEVEGESAAGLAGDTVNIEKPEVRWHREDDIIVIVAEKGTLHRKANDVHFEGEVSVKGENFGSMDCDKLDWNGGEKKMTAQGGAKGFFYIDRYKKENAQTKEKTE